MMDHQSNSKMTQIWYTSYLNDVEYIYNLNILTSIFVNEDIKWIYDKRWMYARTTS